MILLLVLCTFGLSAALDSRVYKGQDLRYDVHTYLVKLEIYRRDAKYCSGSIISNSWIITAAHCLYKDFRKLVVYHGDGARYRQLAMVEKFDIKIHPKYNPNKATVTNVARDVALVYLRKQLQLGGYITLIVSANFYPIVGESGTIAGYGEHEASVNAPREGTVVIATSNIGTGIITSTGPSWVGHGDSGGPLIVRGHLTGVISKTCNLTLATWTCEAKYASVAVNLDWIQLVTNSIV